MRLLITLCTLLFSLSVIAQKKDTVKAQAYTWKSLQPIKEETRERRQVLEGPTSALANFEIHTTTLEPGKAPHPPHMHADEEELIIVKEGKLSATINGKTQELEPGSVAFAIPGDMHGFKNTSESSTTYYVIKYKSKLPLNAERGKTAGGSFMIHWDSVAFIPHDKGGVRRFFERPTALMSRFEMHVTTLNEGLKSHDPHTHVAEEIILMVKGDGQMQIGQNFYRVSTGDLTYVSSMAPHAIKNTGRGSCTYFAFTWTP